MITITIKVVKRKEREISYSKEILIKKIRIVYYEPHEKWNKKEVPKNKI